MKVNNPLSQTFLLNYPAEAARVLEQIPVEHVAMLLGELPPQTGAPVMAVMLPGNAAACLDRMTVISAANLMAELPGPSAVRVFRLLAPTKQNEVTDHLPDKIRHRIRRYLKYPPESVGTLFEPKIDMLSENATVAEAKRSIERLTHPANCELYIIDDAHRLVGIVELGKLLKSNQHAKLRDIMNRKTQPISVHTSARTLLSHPGWSSRRKLPVLERDKTLLGVLDYTSLLEAVGETGSAGARDPLENFLSLLGLYWLSGITLLNTVLSNAPQGRGDKQ